METVEILIKIPKKEYDYMIANPTRYNVCDDEALLYNYIKEGTPLSKGHGRLIDADSMKRIDAIQRGDFNSVESIRAWIDIMPTVIEADRDCKTCKNSIDGKCAGTEECHECM